ncbi:MAG: RrF2 family transcriptional regulator [Gemmatimonadota bacterium]
MLYSLTCEYAIRALTYLAQRPPGRLSLLGDIAEACDLPRPFLGKILQDLVRHGFLRSSRGPSGGYGLAYPPAEITVLQIKQVFDGLEDLERCAVGLDPCSDETPCPLHERFKPLRAAILAYLEETTLDDLVRGLWEKQALLERARIRAGLARES